MENWKIVLHVEGNWTIASRSGHVVCMSSCSGAAPLSLSHWASRVGEPSELIYLHDDDYSEAIPFDAFSLHTFSFSLISLVCLLPFGFRHLGNNRTRERERGTLFSFLFP